MMDNTAAALEEEELFLRIISHTEHIHFRL